MFSFVVVWFGGRAARIPDLLEFAFYEPVVVQCSVEVHEEVFFFIQIVFRSASSAELAIEVEEQHAYWHSYAERYALVVDAVSIELEVGLLLVSSYSIDDSAVVF